MPITNLLADSSCVFGLLCPDLAPDIASQVPPESKNCVYFRGDYLRKEFLQRWVLVGIEVYLTARQLGNLSEAVQHHTNRFSGRDVKIVLQWVNIYMQRCLRCPPEDVIEQFGWEVLRLARAYDIRFPRRVAARTGCERGQLDFDEPSLTLAARLRDFYKAFTEANHRCRLDSLLGCTRGGDVALVQFRNTDLKSIPKETRKGMAGLQKNLEEHIKNRLTPGCKPGGCSAIGDLLIVLEQPASHVLYHTDHVFSALCPIFGKKQSLVKMQSVAKLIDAAAETESSED
jgi:hypothetical protein